jgi:catechol 2,3-dioxygenase-like lactoylglutathione lyase family enzyme
MLIKEANITINVKNMERSIDFYLALGLTIRQRWENYYAQLVAPGLTIGLHPSRENKLETVPGNVSIGFTTDDFEGCRLQLEELLIPVMMRTEEGGQFLHFTDPDGTALYFIKPKWN